MHCADNTTFLNKYRRVIIKDKICNLKIFLFIEIMLKRMQRKSQNFSVDYQNFCYLICNRIYFSVQLYNRNYLTRKSNMYTRVE